MDTREMIDLDRKITMLSTQSRQISDKIAIAIYLTEKVEKLQRDIEELLKEGE